MPGWWGVGKEGGSFVKSAHAPRHSRGQQLYRYIYHSFVSYSRFSNVCFKALKLWILCISKSKYDNRNNLLRTKFDSVLFQCELQNYIMRFFKKHYSLRYLSKFLYIKNIPDYFALHIYHYLVLFFTAWGQFYYFILLVCLFVCFRLL